MPTRLYLPSAGAPAITPGFAAWSRTTEAVRRQMETTKRSSVMTSATIWAAISPTANQTALSRQFVSKPIQAGVVFATSDTFKCQVRCQESAVNDNINRQPICIKIYDSSGGTIQATLKALGHIGPNTTEWGTALTNKKVADGDTLDAGYTTAGGEYLVVEIGGQVDATGGTSVTGTMSWGDDSATDLAENETDTAANNPWIEFSNTITFITPAADCSQTSQRGLIPIEKLAGSSYIDPLFVRHVGGSYLASGTEFTGTGSNVRPTAIDAVMPTVTAVSGVIGVAFMGGSTMSRIADAVGPAITRDPTKASTVLTANCGVSGIRTNEWANSGDAAWTVFNDRIVAAGIAATQLRVVFWTDYANAAVRTFEGEVSQNATWIEAVVANLVSVYPSLQIVYLCAHHYVGYADQTSSPDVHEPDNYWNSWSIQRVITGRSGTAAPWTVAGPPLWGNGTLDDFICLDFEQASGSAGVHMNPSGEFKATDRILNFLHKDHSARWYRAVG